MDQVFEMRWRASSPPFDGVTLCLPSPIALTDLRLSLEGIVNVLAWRYGRTGLYQFTDWHQHDGFITRATASSWDDLRNHLGSDHAFRKVCPYELGLRTAFFSREREFLLRVSLSEAYDSTETFYHGVFDITCHETLAQRLIEAAVSVNPADLQIVPAKAFFDRCYGGAAREKPKQLAPFFRNLVRVRG